MNGVINKNIKFLGFFIVRIIFFLVSNNVYQGSGF